MPKKLSNRPIILYETKNTKEGLEALIKDNKVLEIRDIFESQSRELLEIDYPNLKKKNKYFKEEREFLSKRRKNKHLGNWVFFPWNGHLVRCLGKEEYYRLRTNRNRNLITVEEQSLLKNFCVGIAGLSVGSNIAISLSYLGVNTMKLAEFDTIETTNLNRIRAGLSDIGLPKLDIAAQQIYELNPYSKLKLYSEGLTRDCLDDFLTQEPKPKLVFEIIDNFEMKILLRLKARGLRIPVIMLANVHDKIIIDIERYDLDKRLPLFNGILGDLPEEILKNPGEDPNKYAVEIVGRENISERAINSVKEINKTLVGRPQLNTTVTVSSGLATYFARRVALNEKLPSGRRIIDLNSFI